MDNKLGISTGKGFVDGVYDEYAKTAGQLKTKSDSYNSSGMTTVELDDNSCGIYAIYLYDDINEKYISEIVYIANALREHNISISGGTLRYHPVTDVSNAYFDAISSDLQYMFDIISVTKIATIANG